MRAIILPIALFVATLHSLAAAADPGQIHDSEAATQYKHCISIARSSPDEGYQEALAWASMGGGEAARHCQAIALINQRAFDQGAAKLEELAHNGTSSAKIRAGMLAQAGQAWLLAHQPDRAFTDQTEALALVPGAPDLLIDRAQSQAEQKDYQGALNDLNLALSDRADRADALTFRAAAKRYLDDMAGAKADIAQALKLDDHYEDAWLEDGIEKSLEEDKEGARRSWANVLSLAPKSEAAVTAKKGLDLLDAEKD
jgi:tetratricopeptide (TPR) repeat protein